MKKIPIALVLISFMMSAHAAPTLNLYTWGGVLPKQIIHQFENETGIHVNFSTYDSNETMLAKLKASREGVYDLILPSAYYVERMNKQGMLVEIDAKKLENIQNLDPSFRNNDYDPNNRHSIPLTWGATGIFYNDEFIKKPVLHWHELWDKSYVRQLMLLDDSRDIFSIALIKLHYSPNSKNEKHIESAYHELLKLIPNIKLFASDSIQAIIIDDDAHLGVSWNSDAYKAHRENPHIQFVYPQEGFVVWVDCMAIPRGAKHLKEAYAFMNFMLRPEIAKIITEKEGLSVTNAAAKTLLTSSQKMNPMLFPSSEILSHGIVQRDVPNDTLELSHQYWEQFKMSF